MNVGFTGTREGMTDAQKLTFRVAIIEPVEDPGKLDFHYGCCVGADTDAARIVYHRGYRRIVGHPPNCDVNLSETALGFNTENHDPLPYLARNKRIVDACDVLVACPKGPEEQRSGTWSTVRYARKQKKRILIIWPDGRVTQENDS